MHRYLPYWSIQKKSFALFGVFLNDLCTKIDFFKNDCRLQAHIWDVPFECKSCDFFLSTNLSHIQDFIYQISNRDIIHRRRYNIIFFRKSTWPGMPVSFKPIFNKKKLPKFVKNLLCLKAIAYRFCENLLKFWQIWQNFANICQHCQNLSTLPKFVKNTQICQKFTLSQGNSVPLWYPSICLSFYLSNTQSFFHIYTQPVYRPGCARTFELASLANKLLVEFR